MDNNYSWFIPDPMVHLTWFLLASLCLCGISFRHEGAKAQSVAKATSDAVYQAINISIRFKN